VKVSDLEQIISSAETSGRQVTDIQLDVIAMRRLSEHPSQVAFSRIWRRCFSANQKVELWCFAQFDALQAGRGNAGGLCAALPKGCARTL